MFKIATVAAAALPFVLATAPATAAVDLSATNYTHHLQGGVPDAHSTRTASDPLSASLSNTDLGGGSSASGSISDGLVSAPPLPAWVTIRVATFSAAAAPAPR